MSHAPSIAVSTSNCGGGVGQTSAASAPAASESEKSASTSTMATATATPMTTTPGPAPKLRSCVTCRSRKVRCDKQNPCSNCRRANIPCVVPSNDRPPRWARRLERAAHEARSSPDAGPDVSQAMERLRTLEVLVKDLTSQLEQAHAAANSTGGDSSGVSVNSPGSSVQDTDTSTSGLQKQFGRLVVQDSSKSRYVGSGFWSRVNDEIEGLEIETKGLVGSDSDSSEDEEVSANPPATQELDRSPSERHAFLFKHNLTTGAPNTRDLYPLPSQIPFLLDVYSENVNVILQIVHMPTVLKTIGHVRGNDLTTLTPANEALMFAMCYAAVTSMEEEDIMTNFGTSKAELNLKYRLGLEHALAKADFLNVPDLVLVQAFTIFLFLVRRHDSPRFVWMMTGLVIRMAQALGLHRDGSHFAHLTPFEVEIRRRVWWALCVLDVRASEDQGTEFTIAHGSFDTKHPANINDSEIGPDSTEAPAERHGVTDATFAVITFEICEISRKMVALGFNDGASGIEEQIRLFYDIYEKLDITYLQHAEKSQNITYWVVVTATRLVMAKMTLLIYLPVLFSSPSEHFSDEVRSKLLVAAIEVAEYNHALNAEQACRAWRWVFQTYTHWHATVYLLIETSRRRWSPIVERAWIALHSTWLIPPQENVDKNLRIWIPLRKLMSKARKHRDAELERLKSDAQAAQQLEMEDRNIPEPASSGPLPSTNSSDFFLGRWRKLVGLPETRSDNLSGEAASPTSMDNSASIHPSTFSSVPTQNGFENSPSTLPQANNAFGSELAGCDLSDQGFGINPGALGQGESAVGGLPASAYAWPSSDISANVSYDQSKGQAMMPWLWADTDPSVDVFADVDMDAISASMGIDVDVNWHDWVTSAQGMEWSTGN